MKNSTALITGVNRGFGLELTRQYCSLGWRVFGILRNKEAADKLSSELGDVFIPILGDIRDSDVTQIITQGLGGKTDYLSLLINNAGISGAAHKVEEISCNEIRELFDVHCCGTIRCVQAALPYLRNADSPTIVNMTSRLGSINNVSSGKFDHIPASYGMRMAKAAQNMLSASLHRELRESGIAVFAVHPGTIITRMASPDADMSAEQAAKRFINWLPKIRKEREFGYFEAGGDELLF